MNLTKNIFKTNTLAGCLGGAVLFLFIVILLVSGGGNSDKETTTNDQIVNSTPITNEVESATVTKTELRSEVTPAPNLVQDTPRPTSSVSASYTVTDVVDGDTIKINKNGTVVTLRLIGMDTPETVDPRKPVQCFGREASNKAKELLLGKKITIEQDSTQGELDKYGRLLAYVHREDGLFYNKYMIEQGYAYEYTYNTPYKYQSQFKEAQKTAQSNLMGLWSPNTCNGDTTSETATPTETSTGKYYTSSIGTKYYPDTCSAWESLSKSNLKTFNSLSELLAAYPNRTLAEACK